VKRFKAEPRDAPAAQDWPGKSRREPARSSSAYLITREIVRSLVSARDRHLHSGLRVLDVGCGVQPYYPLFADLAAEYDGHDIEPGAGVKYVSPAETLEAPDDAYDLVLCTQVLEHVRYPAVVLSEIARVLVPGGYVFLTTHGVYPFHPHPTDYWRWTQQGLEALVEDTEGLEFVELVPHGGSAAALAIMINTPIRQASKALGAEFIGSPLISLVNAVAGTIDRVLPTRANAAMIPNFLVVARRV
jgi:2-polyprenyl-3-methyl-5-hydroxy-6-metoxy-1,4-benzoquinol methylase